MKNASTILGIALMGTLLMSFTGSPGCKTDCEVLAIDEITYIEPTEEVELDFDTAKYLPEGFDAYQGMGPNLEEIAFIEPTEDIDLGFDTARYLPIGFDAYKGMEIDLNDIEYIEEEVELDLNVQSYLPGNFNASVK